MERQTAKQGEIWAAYICQELHESGRRPYDQPGGWVHLLSRELCNSTSRFFFQKTDWGEGCKIPWMLMRKMPCEVHKVSQMKLDPYLNNSWLMCSQCKLSGLPQIVGATREPWDGGLDTSRYIMHQCFFSGVKQHLMNTDSFLFFNKVFLVNFSSLKSLFIHLYADIYV